MDMDTQASNKTYSNAERVKFILYKDNNKKRVYV
jgi:hypothetical protein